MSQEETIGCIVQGVTLATDWTADDGKIGDVSAASALLKSLVEMGLYKSFDRLHRVENIGTPLGRNTRRTTIAKLATFLLISLDKAPVSPLFISEHVFSLLRGVASVAFRSDTPQLSDKALTLDCMPMNEVVNDVSRSLVRSHVSPPPFQLPHPPLLVVSSLIQRAVVTTVCPPTPLNTGLYIRPVYRVYVMCRNLVDGVGVDFTGCSRVNSSAISIHDYVVHSLNSACLTLTNYWIINFVNATQRTYQHAYGVRNVSNWKMNLKLAVKLEGTGSITKICKFPKHENLDVRKPSWDPLDTADLSGSPVKHHDLNKQYQHRDFETCINKHVSKMRKRLAWGITTPYPAGLITLSPAYSCRVRWRRSYLQDGVLGTLPTWRLTLLTSASRLDVRKWREVGVAFLRVRRLSSVEVMCVALCSQMRRDCSANTHDGVHPTLPSAREIISPGGKRS
uniref:Uncharacterized protein n=1 Tax=Timema monikensis TaxID=170555 RepID=A0A7R9E1N1_9NEOP|nr:unnamed protein product [Timema monikensis]